MLSIRRKPLFAPRLAHSHTMTPFDAPGKQAFLKTLWEKKKLLVTSNFSFIHIVFYPFRELSAIFIKFKIVVCRLFQFGRVENLLFGKGLILYLTVPTFNDPKEEGLGKHCGKRRKCC